MLARLKLTGAGLLACLFFIIGLIFFQGSSPTAALAEERGPIQSGIKSYQKGLYLKAIKNLEEGIQKTSTPPPEAFYFLGASFNQLGEYDQAIKALKKALVLKPDYSEVYLELGIAFYNKKKYSEALSALNKALKADPKNGAAHFFRGLALQSLDKTDLAISSFQVAGAVDPDFQQLTRFNVGLLNYRNNRYEEAKAQLKASIDADPESDTAEAAGEFLELIKDRKPPKPWRAAFRAGASIDDNVTLTNFFLTTGLGDLLTFYSFSGAYLWEPIETYKLNVGYDFYQSIYDSLHQFDLQTHTGFVNATKSFDDFDMSMGYTFNFIELDGIEFEYIHTFNTGLSFEPMDGWFVDLSYFLNSKDFPNIPSRNGHNHSLRISNYFTLGNEGGLAWVAYAPEGEVVRSRQVSYVAQNISVGAQHPVPGLESLKTMVRANYQYTYQDFQAITPFIGVEREDFQNSVSFEIIQPVLDNFDVTFKYQYINRESNLPTNDFVRNIFSLSVGATF